MLYICNVVITGTHLTAVLKLLLKHCRGPCVLQYARENVLIRTEQNVDMISVF